MNNIVLLIIILVSTFTGGYLFGSKVEEYNHAIDKVQAVSQTLKQERAKQDAKDKELAEANKLISNLRTLNERVQRSSNKPSKTYNRANESVYDFENLRKDAVQLLHDISKELTN